MKTFIEPLRDLVDTGQMRLIEIRLAALLRDYAFSDSDEQWTNAENYAFAVIGNIEDHVPAFDPDDIDGRNERIITLAAHTLWSAAQRRARQGDLHEAVFVALNAAIGFLYAANLGSAAAVAHAISAWPVADPVFRLIRDVLDAIKRLPDPTIARPSPTMAALQRYYQGCIAGEPAAPLGLQEPILAETGLAARALSVGQLALIYRFEQAIPWLAHFLMPPLMERFVGMRNGYTEHIRSSGPFFAFPSQRHALLLLRGQSPANTLITYPTSTGKTFIGELLAIEGLLRGGSGVAVYVAPYRAIVSQIVERDQRLIESAGIRFVRAMGGYMEGLADISSGERVFLVTTPEAFDYALRSQPEVVRRISAVAVDELHLIEQTGRGTLLEALVGRLRDLQRDHPIRLIGLSAVVSDTAALQRWLGVPDSHVLRTGWTPSRKRFEIQRNDDRALFYGDDAASADQGAQELLRWSFSSGIGGVAQNGRQRSSPSVLNQISQRAAEMAGQMYQILDGSILVICASKRDTRTLARMLLDQTPPDAPVTPTRQRLEELIVQRYPHHRTLLSMLPHAVCYHNADIEYEVRDLLQKLIEERFFRVVVATTTLAEGVDLPFRAVLMHRWSYPQDDQPRVLFRPLLMRNIVGRCGRAGMFVEGDTIFFDNPTDDASYQAGRIAAIEQQYIAPQQLRLRSSLELLPEGAPPDSEVFAQLESGLLALVNQRQPLERPVETFAKLLFAGPEATARFTGHLEGVLQAELRKPAGALLAANSPVRLTEYGTAAVQTGLSIRSASAIAARLGELLLANTRPTDKARLIQEHGLRWDGLLDRALDLLDDLGELRNRNRTRVVTQANLRLLVWAWVSGWSLPALLWVALYRALPDDDPRVSWLRAPERPDETLEEQIAELHGFCDSYFAHGWSRVLRAVRVFLQFSPFEGRDAVMQSYQLLSDRVTLGVGEPLAVQVLEPGRAFPAGRTEAQILAVWCGRAGVFDLEALRQLPTLPTPADLTAITLDPMGISRLSMATAVEICNWLLGLRGEHE
ncbi:MAG: hypothetical protein OHK0022_10700 [Roseiflexaceae bacterium]